MKKVGRDAATFFERGAGQSTNHLLAASEYEMNISCLFQCVQTFLNGFSISNIQVYLYYLKYIYQTFLQILDERNQNYQQQRPICQSVLKIFLFKIKGAIPQITQSVLLDFDAQGIEELNISPFEEISNPFSIISGMREEGDNWKIYDAAVQLVNLALTKKQFGSYSAEELAFGSILQIFSYKNKTYQMEKFSTRTLKLNLEGIKKQFRTLIRNIEIISYSS